MNACDCTKSIKILYPITANDLKTDSSIILFLKKTILLALGCSDLCFPILHTICIQLAYMFEGNYIKLSHQIHGKAPPLQTRAHMFVLKVRYVAL